MDSQVSHWLRWFDLAVAFSPRFLPLAGITCVPASERKLGRTLQIIHYKCYQCAIGPSSELNWPAVSCEKEDVKQEDPCRLYTEAADQNTFEGGPEGNIFLNAE